MSDVIQISITARELATILASLRVFQCERDAAPVEHFAEHAPLDDGEIDRLCERLHVVGA